jgi:8-oxo-dGTP pyrophosphatase MutT (NUDIX family)
MPERILSAGVVVVLEPPERRRVLLLRAFRYWDCPKGLVEPGEAPFVTAMREVREETALTDLEFRWGQDFIETEPYSKNKVARYYLATTKTATIQLPVNPELGGPEHHEWRWCVWDNATRLANPRIARVLDWARRKCEGQ